MSWEVMSDKIGKCECGKGNTRYISEMDDWCNSRSYEYVDCKECYEKYLKYQAKRNSCHNEAKHDTTTYIYVKNVNKCE